MAGVPSSTDVDLGVHPVKDAHRLARVIKRFEEYLDATTGDLAGDEERARASDLQAKVDLIRSVVKPPYSYNVREYGKLIEDDTALYKPHTDEAIVEDPTGENRPNYYGRKAEGPSIALSSIGVYNVPQNQEEKQTISINLDWANQDSNWHEAFELYRALLRDSLIKNDVVCVLPFHAEAGIAHRSVDYAVSVLGVENVVASSTGKSPKAEDEVLRALQGREDNFVRQGNYLAEVIDWRKARECYGIMLLPGEDPKLPPSLGRKGLTMLAGVLKLMEQEKLSRSRVAFHDTDITNPKNYQALEWLGVPLLDPPAIDEYVPAVYVAKTGPGRNNETQTIAAAMTHDTLADFREYNSTLEQDPKAEALLRQYSTLIWMLTGERMISGELLKKMPWSSGMTIETTINLYLLGLQVESERLHICQVLNPQRKVECGTADHEREFAMMQECANWLRKNTLHTAISGRFLHEYRTEDIVAINRKAFHSVPQRMQNFRHQPNSTITIAQDCMLGSIDHMLSEGILKF